MTDASRTESGTKGKRRRYRPGTPPLSPEEAIKLSDSTRRTLAARFPLCFVRRGPRRPLAIGIDRAIKSACPELTWRQIKLAIADYTSSPHYLAATTAGAQRIALNGEPAGTIGAEHAAFAADRLAKMGGMGKAEDLSDG